MLPLKQTRANCLSGGWINLFKRFFPKILSKQGSFISNIDILECPQEKVKDMK